MKKMRYLALAVCLLYVCFFTGCMFIDSAPAYEDRAYRRIEKTETDAMLNDLRAISKDPANARILLRTYKKAIDLLDELVTCSSMALIAAYKDAGDEQAAEEAARVESLYMQYFHELRNCEKELVLSPAKELLVQYLGEAYVTGLLDEPIVTDEQLVLMAEEVELDNRYSVLYAQGDVQGLVDLYVDLIRVRQRIAQSYGYDDYSEYAYAEVYDRDYTLEQVEQLTYYAKKWIAPLYNDTWGYDLDVIYTDISEEEGMSLLDKTIQLLGNKNLQNKLSYMQEKNLYDFSISDKKAPISAAFSLPMYNDAYLLVNNYGTYVDYPTLVHEFGHFNAFLSGEKGLTLAQGSIELAETHSQGLEILALSLYPQLFDKELVAAQTISQLQSYCWAILSNFGFDAFERFAYSLDEETLALPNIGDILNEEFIRIFRDLGIPHEMTFYSVIHLYQYPIYCISYSVSLLTAMQFSQPINGVPAIDVYSELVKHGEYKQLLYVLDKVGMLSPFEESSVRDAGYFIIRMLEECDYPADLSDWPAV